MTESETHSSTIEYPDGTIYVGEYKLADGKKLRHGQGRLSHARIVAKQPIRDEYNGAWAENKMHGLGEYIYASGAVYKGEWKNNKQSGRGFYFFADGSFYEGEWVDHKMHGRGMYVDVKGRKWTGEFVNGSYKADGQKALLLKRAKDDKIDSTRQKADKFMHFFNESFAGDRKKMAEHAKQIFVDKNIPDVTSYYSGAVIKYAEKKPELWFANKGKNWCLFEKRLRGQRSHM